MNTRNIPAVVINLERRPDRLRWFMNNANTSNLKIRQIKAIDAKNEEDLKLIFQYRSQNCKLSDAEIACILSHRKVWKEFVDSAHSHTAIFEDDVYLSEDTATILSYKFLPKDIHLIKLETTFSKITVSEKEYRNIYNRKLFKLLSKHDGSAGYIVSKYCATKLLSITENLIIPIDVLLFNENSVLRNYFDIYQISPAICVQEFFYSKNNNGTYIFHSDIQTSRNYKRNKKYAFKFIQRIFKYLNFVLKGANPFCYRKSIRYK